jgi:hypothetical protein
MKKILGDELSFFGNGDTLLPAAAGLPGFAAKLTDPVFAPSFSTPANNVVQAGALTDAALVFDVLGARLAGTTGNAAPIAQNFAFMAPDLSLQRAGHFFDAALSTTAHTSQADNGVGSSSVLSSAMAESNTRYLDSTSLDSQMIGPQSISPAAPAGSPAASAPTPGLTISWAGVTQSTAGGWNPADSNMAAGTNNIIAVVNDHIDVYSKTGTNLYSQSLNTFFNVPSSNFVFDPRAMWDQYSGRFVVVADDQTGSNSHVHIAVSIDSNPLDGWYNYDFNFKNGNSWIDYPVLGIDASNVYISGNYFDLSTDNYTFSGVWAINKSNLESGAATTAYLYNPASLGAPYSDLYVSAHMYGTHAGLNGDFFVEYGPNNAGNDTLRIDRIENAGTGTATFNLQSLNVGNISDAFPSGARQAGTSTLIADGDWRIQDAVWRADKLYAVTEIRVGSGASAHDVVHWFVVDTSNLNALTLLSQGNVDYGSDYDTYYGNLTVDNSGNMIIGYSFSGPGTAGNPNRAPVYASSVYAVIPAGGTGLTDGGFYLTPGQGVNTGGRWGDYSGVAIDPADDGSFWVFNQYATNSNSWATTVGGYQVPQTNATLRIVDIISNSDSGESFQNSEPSLAVDPLDPTQMIAGTFGGGTPYFKTTNGGSTWIDYGNLNTQDKSLAWKQDGSAALTTTLLNNVISTYSGTSGGSNFGSPINNFNSGHDVDQPWIRTGPSNHVYVGYNDLDAPSGKTATVLVSTNGGSTYAPVTVDKVGAAAGQDAPSIRLAVNGNTVYSAFTRWNSILDTDAFGETRFGSQVVIVRSDNGGADNFAALGTGGNGVQVATMTSVFANTSNAPLTLGQERTGGDIAIAVDPNNAQHVVIAYGNAPGAKGSGQLQLVVAESTNGGANWTTKFTTSASTRSAEPALAILTDGTIGLLYNNYAPSTNKLSQHLLTTTNDFINTTDTLLATESNATPAAQFSPYVGDFFDLTSVGNTFYGIFSASNADNGTDGQFSNVALQRNFTGTPGTSSFHLTNAGGGAVPFSVDPFFFSYQLGGASAGSVSINDVSISEGNSGTRVATFTVIRSGGTAAFDVSFTTADNTATTADHDYVANAGTLHFGAGVNTQTISVTINGDTKLENSETFHVNLSGATNGAIISDNSALGTIANDEGTWSPHEFNGDGKNDFLWRNDSGAVATWDMNDRSSSGAVIATVTNDWHIADTGDFNGDGRSDILWRNDSGSVATWNMNDRSSSGLVIGSASSDWHIAGTGDFNGDHRTDILWRNDSGAVATWDMNDRSANGAVIASASNDWHIAGTGDFNGDGKTDILWRNDSGAVATWNMNDRSSSGLVIANVSNDWHIAGTGDFNGDGKTDILWRNDSGAVATWDMNDRSSSGLVIANVSNDWHIAETGDFNGDHKTDILWRNDNGAVATWDMDDRSYSGLVIATTPNDWHIV